MTRATKVERKCPTCGRTNRFDTRARARCGACGRDLPWIVDAHDASFDEAVRTHMLVLVDLWAPWCGPCRIVAPTLERLAADLAGRMKLVKVNVDEAPALHERYRVRSIPTLLLLLDGVEVDRLVGAAPPGRLRSWVDAAVERETG